MTLTRREILSIIVVSWNSGAELFDCLRSIRDIEDLPVNIETIVIENGSKDGTREMLERSAPSSFRVGTRIIYNNANVGLSLATEQAYKEARGNRILLCNPDLILNSTLNEMLQHSFNHPAEMLTAELIERDGSVQKFHRRFPNVSRAFFTFGILGSYLDEKLMRSFALRKYRFEDERIDRPTLIEQPGATVLMFTRDTVEKLGNIFCPDFPVWWNDVDLAKRADQAGILRVLLPKAKFIHSLGQSQKKLPKPVVRYFFFRGMITYAKKWNMHPRIVRCLFIIDGVFGVPLMAIVQRRAGLQIAVERALELASSQIAGVLSA